MTNLTNSYIIRPYLYRILVQTTLLRETPVWSVYMELRVVAAAPSIVQNVKPMQETLDKI